VPSADYLGRQVQRAAGDETKLRTALSKQDAKNAKLRTDVLKAEHALERATSQSTARQRTRQLESARTALLKGTKLAAKASSGVATTSAKRVRLQQQLDRAIAQERRRQARPVVRYVDRIREVPSPIAEKLRVLYLIANPDAAGRPIRPDVEIRAVRKVVERAVHSEAIEIYDRHAVTFDDLRDEIDLLNPHVLHFSGHAGSSTLEFDNAELAPLNEPVTRSFDQVAKVLAEIGLSVQVLVLNACDTLDGAEVFLESVPVVVATTRSIDDMEAVVFATNFYSSIAAGESIDTALTEAKKALGTAWMADASCIESLTREGLDLSAIVLVRGSEAKPGDG